MAIIQISKIQQRSGNLVDLPQLDEAQFGFAQDARRLFIGKTTGNAENIEVLTSYSNISFSQIEGSDGSNIYISGSPEPGQILAYANDGNVINSWVNAGGNAGGLIDLGAVANVKIGNGAVGYVLTTDGLGNLSWSPKTTSVANIANITVDGSNAAILTFDPTIVSYTNGTAITILGVEGASNSTVNGETFYVKVSPDFDTSGEASLYISDSLDTPNAFIGAGITYTNAPNGTATNTFGSSGSTPAVGENGTIQFAVANILAGSSLLKFANGALQVSSSNITVANGNITVSNGNVSGNYLTGTLTTNAQPNITSIGTLSALSVTGNGTFGNVVGGNLITANNITVSSVSDLGDLANVRITGGNPIDVIVTTDGLGNLAWATITFDVLVNGTSNVIVTQDGNVTTSIGGVPDVFTITGTGANVTGTISASGNVNVGNLGTVGLITSTGNITGGNLITGGVVSASGNATVLGIKTDNYYYANGNPISLAGSYGNSNVASFLASYGSNTVTTTGNISAGNISATTIAGSLTTSAQPNITSLGTVTGLTVAGNIIPSANVTYDLGNATNSFKDLYLSGNTIYIGTSTITATPSGVTINTPGSNAVTLKPAGADTQVQYNNNGAFGGNPGMTFNELTSALTVNNFVATSTANLGAIGNVTITGGSNGQYLTTNGSGVLSWTTGSGNGNSYGDSNVVTLLSSYGSNSISTTGNVTAKYLINSVTANVTAAGSNSNTATALTSTINIVTTIPSGSGVKLPNAVAGMTIYITARDANSLTVYPSSGAINSAAANFIQPANSTIHYIASSSTQWYTVGASMAMYT